VNTAICERALELGFDDCRFAAAAPPATAPHFQRWLQSHHHGEMAYLERNAPKRVDPQQVLAGVRSVVSLAVSYASGDDLEKSDGVLRGACSVQNASNTPAPPSMHHALSGRSFPAKTEPRNTGTIARYARFTDYHNILAERLKSLAAFVTQLGGEGTRSLWYVDTGPLLERDLAQRAGLGFIGKHTNLISRRLGNWIFLSEILTTLELVPDAPEQNHCGTCTRCLTACPTAAIIAPFQLDARRCISYLTIELKGPIPVELRREMGNRIYGCDDCLAACPWNRFARTGRLMKEHARPGLAMPDLLKLLALDNAAFKQRFHGTPILRAKRRGFLRNVCVALGNVGDASALPALDRASRDPESLIVEHARWAIEEIRKRE
jgi:epoxyqueuosine reductase